MFSLATDQALVEEQLADGRQWLLDTESIGLLDVSAQMFFAWGRSFRVLKELFSAEAYPNTLAVSLFLPDIGTGIHIIR